MKVGLRYSNNLHMKTSWHCTLLILMSALNNVRGAQHFIEQPTDITAKLGDTDVTFPCKVAEKKGILQWTQDGFGLGTNRSLQGFARYEMIGSIEEGEYNLFIRTVLLSDDAEYQCQVGAADGDPSIMSTVAKLTVQVPPKDSPDMVSIDKQSPLQATEGAQVRLICMVRSVKPDATIKWFNGDSEITSDVKSESLELPDSKLTSVRSTLNLTPGKSHHEANISCQVKHVALETPIVRSVKMKVKYKPHVKISVDSAKIKEGDDVNVTCTATGNPNELTYRWEDSGQNVVGDFTTFYVIRGITRDKNNAQVTCYVTNEIGESSASEKLAVTYKPYFKSEPADVDQNEGASVELTCNVDANPKPEIIWTREESDKVINIGPKITVAVSRETIGTYHCRAAVSGFAEASRSMKVFMRGPPTVLPNQAYYGLEGMGNVAILCRVSSIPRPTSLLWSRRGQLIYPNEKYTIRENRTRDGIVNTLVIKNPHYDDFGLYNCTANNTFGSHTELISLRRHQSLPLITTLVSIIGGIIFLVIVVAAIVLFRRKGLDYKDPSFEKHSMHSNDHCSTSDSVMKVETRTGTYTGTASELSPSDAEDDEEDDDYSTEEWASTNIDEEQSVNMPAVRNTYRFTTEMNGTNNRGGAYVPYVDYQRDYNPPPAPPNYNRNTVYTTVPLNNMNVIHEPRHSLALSGQSLAIVSAQNQNVSPVVVSGSVAQPSYIKLPSNARVVQGLYNSGNAVILPKNNATVPFTPNLGPPNTNFVPANVSQSSMNFGGGLRLNNLPPPSTIHNISNNLNDPNNIIDKNAIYSQASNRGGARNIIGNASQYISIPQNDLGRGGMGTHI